MRWFRFFFFFFFFLNWFLCFQCPCRWQGLILAVCYLLLCSVVSEIITKQPMEQSKRQVKVVQVRASAAAPTVQAKEKPVRAGRSRRRRGQLLLRAPFAGRPLRQAAVSCGQQDNSALCACVHLRTGAPLQSDAAVR